MPDLAWRLTEFDDRLFRSIPTIRPSEDLWDDLTADPAIGAVMAEAVDLDKPRVAMPNLTNAPFDYHDKHTAVDAPATPMATRYSDGTFAVWYGSLRPAVCVIETLYWFVQGAVEDHAGDYGVSLTQQRHIGSARCRALLIDLRDQQDEVPDLVDPHDHRYCRAVGRRIQSEGHPGLLAPSARAQGDNAAVFRRTVLSDARSQFYADYLLDPSLTQVQVIRGDREIAVVEVADLTAGEQVAGCTLDAIEAS